jgi:hypothetical protein
MDNIRNKYEIILGFITLIISLSTFKEELKLVIIDLGFVKINLAYYLLLIIIGFSFSLYLYVLEKVLEPTKIGSWKIFDYILKFAYYLFVFILLSPIVILVYIILSKVYNTWTAVLHLIMSVTLGVTYTLISFFISRYIRKLSKQKRTEEMQEKEIKELENTIKLFQEGFYSHAILESFKLLIIHLTKNLSQKGIRVSTINHNEIIKMALNNNLLNNDELIEVNNIRAMRNISAHNISGHTKEQAEESISFVKKMLLK